MRCLVRRDDEKAVAQDPVELDGAREASPTQRLGPQVDAAAGQAVVVEHRAGSRRRRGPSTSRVEPS